MWPAMSNWKAAVYFRYGTDIKSTEAHTLISQHLNNLSLKIGLHVENRYCPNSERPMKFSSLSCFPVKAAKPKASIHRVIFGFVIHFSFYVIFKTLGSADNRRNNHTAIPIDSLCCFCWASKHVCLNKHIVLQIDWLSTLFEDTLILLKSNKVLYLKAARIASDD